MGCHFLGVYLYWTSGKEGNIPHRAHGWSMSRHKIGKLKLFIILWRALGGAAVVVCVRGQDGRDRVESGSSSLLTVWKRPNLYFVYLTV